MNLVTFHQLTNKQLATGTLGHLWSTHLLEQQMGWQWHQMDHMQIICTSLQTDDHATTSTLDSYRLDALPATQPTASKHW